jgi:hypothetical protein
LAVSLLFDEKISQSAALFWFGLQIVGFLQTFYSRAVIQRAIVVLSRIFGARFGGKDHDAFLYLAAQNFELFSNLQDQN